MISRQIINVEQDFLFYLKGQIAPFKIIIIILVNFYYMRKLQIKILITLNMSLLETNHIFEYLKFQLKLIKNT